jgi:hypothetical protein
MTAKTELSVPKRRTRAEVQQLVAEFVSSGIRPSEFCQSRGLSFSTLDRHLKKRRFAMLHAWGKARSERGRKVLITQESGYSAEPARRALPWAQSLQFPHPPFEPLGEMRERTAQARTAPFSQ